MKPPRLLNVAKFNSKTHLKKYVFGFFAPLHLLLALKLAKSANKGKKYFERWASKNAEFHADFKSVKNVP